MTKDLLADWATGWCCWLIGQTGLAAGRKVARVKITNWLRGTLRAGRAGEWCGARAAPGCRTDPLENLANCRTSAAGWGMIGVRAPDV